MAFECKSCGKIFITPNREYKHDGVIQRVIMRCPSCNSKEIKNKLKEEVKKMCEKCNELRAKCFILFPLADIGVREEIEDKIEDINEILNSMGFSHMEKHGLKFCLNNTKILDQ